MVSLSGAAAVVNGRLNEATNQVPSDEPEDLEYYKVALANQIQEAIRQAVDRLCLIANVISNSRLARELRLISKHLKNRTEIKSERTSHNL